ncbi:hypothetical protein ACFSC6_12075 [Rufibacter sediminis]|uniref:Uncharacterized protein n=1 Tax=Rufibacter sediminis TaxID=2762756 RepID=A0ABR6VTU9_9BACT|nr:hypothetical protein [Rufibacter sediminis]MBC3540619.1 hypothetical protein [Rufibacter sediminis]
MPKSYTLDQLHEANEYMKNPAKDGMAQFEKYFKILKLAAQNMESIGRPESGVAVVPKYPFQHNLDECADFIMVHASVPDPEMLVCTIYDICVGQQKFRDYRLPSLGPNCEF